MGYDQTDHNRSRCVRRITQCSLGCDMRHMEMDWLAPHKEVSAVSLHLSGMNGFNDRRQEELDDLEVTATHSDHDKKIETMESESITFQQYHQQYDCPKRLVYCPRQCLEWVAFEDLQKHLDEKCPKRPASPIYCRLGCNQVRRPTIAATHYDVEYVLGFRWLH